MKKSKSKNKNKKVFIPTIIFRGSGRFMIVPSSKTPSLRDFLAHSISSDVEVNAVIDDLTVWAISDFSIEVVKVVVKFLSFLEKIVKPLGIHLRKVDGKFYWWKKNKK